MPTSTTEKIPLQTRIPADLDQCIRDFAAKEKRTFTAQIELILKAGIQALQESDARAPK